MVSSSVSWYGADLSIAHAFLWQGWGPLLKSCFVPYGTFQCVLAQNRWYLRTRTYWTNDFVTTSCCPIKVVLSFFCLCFVFLFLFFFSLLVCFQSKDFLLQIPRSSSTLRYMAGTGTLYEKFFSHDKTVVLQSKFEGFPSVWRLCDSVFLVRLEGRMILQAKFFAYFACLVTKGWSIIKQGVYYKAKTQLYFSACSFYFTIFPGLTQFLSDQTHGLLP